MTVGKFYSIFKKPGVRLPVSRFEENKIVKKSDMTMKFPGIEPL